MHELAHVVLHADQLDSPILDDFDAVAETFIEQQADRLASDSLIPRNEWRSCAARYTNSADDIVSFATRLGHSLSMCSRTPAEGTGAIRFILRDN